MPENTILEKVVSPTEDDDIVPVPGHHAVDFAVLEWGDLEDTSMLPMPNNHGVAVALFDWDDA